MIKNPILLVIDPGLKAPCVEALNCISKITGELGKNPEFKFSHVEYISPFLNKKRLQTFVKNKEIGAVICLGSLANMTQQLSCVHELVADLNALIFKNNIPFFGICFSHQLTADTFGYKINYLKDKHQYFEGKHHNFREIEICHPKFSLLATNFYPSDYYSNNRIDLNFKNAIKISNSWEHRHWEHLKNAEEWTLTEQEFRIKKHIQNFTRNKIVSHARHEQEIWEKKSQINSQLVLAATSSVCKFEGMVHVEKPFYTTQTHPETNHVSQSGYLLLKNFIYMASILNMIRD